MLIFLTALYSLCPVTARTQEGFTVRFLERMAERQIRRFGEQYLTAQPNRVVITLLDSTDMLNLLFGRTLLRYFDSRNIDHSVNARPSSNEASEYLSLSVDVLDWDTDFAFDKIPQKVIRRGSLTTFFELERDPSGERIWRGDFAETYSDSVSVEELNLSPVQSPVEESVSHNIVEPILITGVTGVVVYLFYALRSR